MKKERHLINSGDQDFQKRHSLDGMDIYRTNEAVNLFVHLESEDVRGIVKNWTSEARESVLKTLEALREEGGLDREFTTRLGDSIFAIRTQIEPRKSTVGDLLNILREED